MVNGLVATFGLLLASLAAPTVLAEERMRGSLDVLMTTPVSTDRIVLAKWWGAFRVVPALALLPAIGAVCLAMSLPDVFPGIRRFGQSPAPLDTIDRIAYVCLPVAMLLAQGAAVTSVGLALATWSRRVGRAVAISVAAYAFVAFLSPILLEIIPVVLMDSGLFGVTDEATVAFLAELVVTTCPLGGQFFTFQTAQWPAAQSRGAFYIGEVIVLLMTVGFAMLVLALTIATFNRCVERVSGASSPRPAAASPRPARTAGRMSGPATRGIPKSPSRARSGWAIDLRTILEIAFRERSDRRENARSSSNGPEILAFTERVEIGISPDGF